MDLEGQPDGRVQLCESTGSLRGKNPRQLRMSLVVPMVVPALLSLSIAGNRAAPRTALKHNGQRWCALAVQDYESRALPLSYGGGRGRKSASCSATRYSTDSAP